MSARTRRLLMHKGLLSDFLRDRGELRIARVPRQVQTKSIREVLSLVSAPRQISGSKRKMDEVDGAEVSKANGPIPHRVGSHKKTDTRISRLSPNKAHVPLTPSTRPKRNHVNKQLGHR